MSRPPSAGLWTGQTDEGEMGAPYNYIDNSIEGLHSLNEMEYPDKSQEYGRALHRMHIGSEHKRSPPHIEATRKL